MQGTSSVTEQRPKSQKSCVRVAVRVRPLLSAERMQGARPIVKVLDKNLIVLMDPGVTASDDFLRLNKSRERRYAFDLAFDEHASQRLVYEESTRGIIDGVCSGMNACVFTYGATGTGKTFTMLGSYTEPGIMTRTLQELFGKLNAMKDEKQFKIKCSFVEVYNENIRDLLGEGRDLDLREDPVKGMCVAGVSEVCGLEKVEHIMDLLSRGNLNRTTEPTAVNETSSRSHAVLQVVVEQSEKGQGAITSIQVGKLSLIDLAGSERASVTNNKGLRLLEGANINRSLLALGNCITALSENANGGKGVFVPYRDSKLTRLLKDSLGGNCQTIMIANVSPCHINYEDTRNTLKYANRAKNIQADVGVNRSTITQHISNYNEIITELRTVVYDLKGKLSDVANSSESVRQASEQWRQELMDNLDERVRLKKSLIDIKTEMGKILAEKMALPGKFGFTPRAKTPHVLDESNADFDDGDEDTQRESRSITERIQEMKLRKRQLESRISENEKLMVTLQAELPSRVKDDDVCAFLLLLFRNQVLEIEAMDREDQMDWIHRNHDEAIRAKDKEIELLKEQVRLRDEMIKTARENVAHTVWAELDPVVEKLIDIDATPLSAEPSIPMSPPGAPRVLCETSLCSPPSVIPSSTRIKGIAESMLMATTGKNSPRSHRVHSNDELGPPPSTAESTGFSGGQQVQAIQGQADQQLVLTPRKKVAGKKQTLTSARPAVPPLLCIQGTNANSPYQAVSTRRSRTENPPNSKQGKRIGAHQAIAKRPGKAPLRK